MACEVPLAKKAASDDCDCLVPPGPESFSPLSTLLSLVCLHHSHPVRNTPLWVHLVLKHVSEPRTGVSLGLFIFFTTIIIIIIIIIFFFFLFYIVCLLLIILLLSSSSSSSFSSLCFCWLGVGSKDCCYSDIT